MEMFYIMYKDTLDPIIKTATENLRKTGDDGMPKDMCDDIEQDADDEGDSPQAKVSTPKKTKTKKATTKNLTSLPVNTPGWMLALRRRVFAYQWGKADPAVHDAVYEAMQLERDALEKKRVEDSAKGLDRAPQDRQRYDTPPYSSSMFLTLVHFAGLSNACRHGGPSTLELRIKSLVWSRCRWESPLTLCSHGSCEDKCEYPEHRDLPRFEFVFDRLPFHSLLRLAFGSNSNGKVFSDLANFADSHYHPFLRWAEQNIFGEFLLQFIWH